ncbi:hypothetical protein [Niveibacterium sp. SC-1]|uniref:hypothetical protein n=1 Tax=Niveibacterium sp. SC-1 TaxID=3135646 RepID=UPI00311E4FA4
MLGLTSLGVVHTAISLVAVGAAIIAFARNGQLESGNRLGQIYFWTTVLTCLTGFGIFQHGGFGKPHALGILTLIVLAVAALAYRTQVFGGLSRYVEVLSYSVTFFFHMIPGVTETSTRLPLGDPLLPNADAPELKLVTGVMLLVLLVAAGLQVRRLRREAGEAPSDLTILAPRT